jgi:hypothetical protein
MFPYSAEKLRKRFQAKKKRGRSKREGFEQEKQKST